MKDENFENFLNEDTEITEDTEFENDDDTEEEKDIEKTPEKAQVLEEQSMELKDIPIKLTVEIAKISMTLEKLLNLQPGNCLELPLAVDAPVNLTVNGKKIGTAELTSIGDMFGVRILKLN